MEFTSVLQFWFEETNPAKYWTKDLLFDQLVRERFLQIHSAVVRGETYEWRGVPEGALAEVIVLDQFSRNMFRESPQSFLYDPLALALAESAIDRRFHEKLQPERRAFLYMPFMHSESKIIHARAEKLFGDPIWGAGSLDFELKHKAIIDRFGRYPHRNRILGRESTPEELEFLKQPNSGF